MVLRRTLPSRLTGAPAPEGGAVAAAVTPAAAPTVTPAKAVETPAAKAPAEVSAASPQAAALAAAAASAFAVGGAPRVLEESFTAPTAPTAPAAPVEPVVSVVPEAPAPQVAPKAEPVAEPAPEGKAQPEAAVPVAAAPAEEPKPVLAVVEEKTQEAVVAAPAEEPKAAPEALAETKPEREAVTQEASTTAAPAQAEPAQAQALQASAEPANPSRPAGGQLRRRVPGGHGPQSAAPKAVPQVKLPVVEAPKATEPVAQPEPQTVAQPTPVAEVKAAPQPAAPEAPQAAPMPRIVLPPVELPAPKAEAPQAPEAAPAVASGPESAPEGSRPARAVKPRDFAAATIAGRTPAESLKAQPAPALTLAPDVPVDTRPLDKVDEELIASGILSGPAGDSLTSALPGSFAMAADEPLAPPRQDFSLATGPVAPPASMGSGLPWQSEPLGGWQLDMPGQTPPPDVFKPQGGMGNTAPISALPESTRMPPPTLPDTRYGRSMMGGMGGRRRSVMSAGLTVAALGAIGFFVWNQANQPGGLEQAKQQLAQFAEPGPRLAEVAGVSSTSGPELLPPPGQMAQGGNTQIGFLSPAPDPNAPITGTSETTMPEDISLMAKLQRAIAEQREAQGQSGISGTAPAEAQASTKGNLTKDQVEAELAAYQKALAENPDNPPNPRSFFRDPDAFMDGRAGANMQADTAAMPDGTLLPPPVSGGTGTARASNELPPPAELYNQNPANLPIVSEPVGSQAPRIRQLQDFAAELMAPEDQAVKIPQGLRPRLAATDFPTLDVLSFVPGKGVVATADGREGVLLIGESINGWELTQVSADVAEFRAGGRSYYVNAQN